MSENQIIEKLTEILRDLLGDDSIILRPETVRSDVAGWDSFAYINFIVAAEMEFGVKFGVADVEAFANVGEIAAKISSARG